MDQPCQAAGWVQDKGEGNEFRGWVRPDLKQNDGNHGSGAGARRVGPSAARERKRRSSSPALVGELLEQTRASSNARAGSSIDRTIWRRAVGGRIADRAEPGRIERNVLHVYAASAVWVQELSLLSEEILERLRRAGFELAAIRFRLKSSAKAPSRPVRPKVIAAAPLPDELRERLEQVDDPALRAMIAEAAARSLALPELPAAERAPSKPPRAPTSAPPGAPNPQSAGPRSARPDPSGPARRAGWRRSRGGRAG